MKTDPLLVERVLRYESKMISLGMKKVHIWVPKANADEIKRIAAEMRANHESA